MGSDNAMHAGSRDRRGSFDKRARADSPDESYGGTHNDNGDFSYTCKPNDDNGDFSYTCKPNGDNGDFSYTCKPKRGNDLDDEEPAPAGYDDLDTFLGGRGSGGAPKKSAPRLAVR